MRYSRLVGSKPAFRAKPMGSAGAGQLGCVSGAALHAGSANKNDRITKAVLGANRERAPRMGPPMERESIAQCTRRLHTPRPMERPCRLVLVGMMGTGKTSVGRL